MTEILVTGLTDNLPKSRFISQKYPKECLMFDKDSDRQQNFGYIDQELHKYIKKKLRFNSIDGSQNFFILRSKMNGLWAFGGKPKEMGFYVPNKDKSVKSILKVGSTIKKLILCHNKLFILSHSGDLYGIGSNRNFQIAPTTKQIIDNIVKVKLNLLNKIDDAEAEEENRMNSTLKKKDTKKSSTENISYMSLDEFGNRTMSNYQKILKAKFTDVFKGNCCTFYSIQRGGIYSQGEKSSGLLGLKEMDKLTNKPMRIDFKFDDSHSFLKRMHKITQVSCGTIHVMAVDNFANCYTWGRNRKFLLGIKDNINRVDEEVNEPELVKITKDLKIVSCHAAETASFCISVRGKVFFWGEPWERMPDCDLINEIPEKLELSDNSLERLGKRGTNRIITKIESYEKNYAFLDVKGTVFTAGSNLNGICGFSRGSQIYEIKKANYLFEIAEQFVIDIKMLERNLALLSYPYRFHKFLKMYFRTSHLDFFIEKSNEIKRDILGLKKDNIKILKPANRLTLNFTSSSDRKKNKHSIEDITPIHGKRQPEKELIVSQGSSLSLKSSEDLDNSLDIPIPAISKQSSLKKKYSTQFTVQSQQSDMFKGFSEIGKTIFLPHIKHQLFPKDRPIETQTSYLNYRSYSQKFSKMAKNSQVFSSRSRKRSMHRENMLTKASSARNFYYGSQVVNKSSYQFKISKKTKKDIYKNTEIFLKKTAERYDLDSLLSIGLNDKQDQVDFRFKEASFDNNKIEASIKKRENNILKCAIDIVNDPSDVSQVVRDKINLKKFFSFDKKQSKKKYLELLNSGMDQEITDTIMYELAMLQKKNSADEIIQGAERMRIKEKREASKHEGKKFENPFLVARKAIDNANSTTKQLIGESNGMVGGIQSLIDKAHFSQTINKKMAKFQKSKNKKSKGKKNKNAKKTKKTKRRRGNIQYQTAVIKEESVEREGSSGEVMLSRLDTSINASNSKVENNVPHAIRMERAKQKLNIIKLDFLGVNGIDTPRKMSPAQSQMSGRTSASVSPIKLARSISPQFSQMLRRQSLVRFPSMQGKDFDNLPDLIKKANRKFEKEGQKKKKKKKELDPVEKKRRIFKKFFEKRSEKNNAVIIRQNIKDAKKSDLLKKEKRQQFFQKKEMKIKRVNQRKKFLSQAKKEELIQRIKMREEKLMETTRKLAIRKRMKKTIKSSFTIICTFNFFHQIQRFLNFRRNVSNDGFHSKSISTIQRWFNKRRSVKNKLAAFTMQKAYQKLKELKQKTKLLNHLTMRKINRKIEIPLLRYKAKITKIEDFFFKKQMIKYFELGILALNWNYQYLKKFNLKGSEPEGVEALRIYNAILAVRYTGFFIFLTNPQDFEITPEEKNFNSRPVLFGKFNAKKRPGTNRFKKQPLNLENFVTDKELLKHISIEQIRAKHPFDTPQQLNLPRTGDRCLKVVNSLFQVYGTKLKIMNEIKKFDGFKLAEAFKFENTHNQLEFWKRLYEGIIQTILPMSRHGKKQYY